MTADSRSGILRIWNVSQKSPLDFVRVKKCGFHTFIFINNSQRALCTFRDGGVGLYDLSRRSWEFLRKVGHMETIFDCKFKPLGPATGATTTTTPQEVLATASFDNTVKLWDTLRMEPIDSLDGHDGVVYCVSWAPRGETRLLSCTSKGLVYYWDTSKPGAPIAKFALHRDAVFRVAWSDHDPALFATASKDGSCLVCRVPDGAVQSSYKIGKPCFGCSWSILHKGLLAVGAADSLVRIYDATRREELPVTILRGHTARVFNTSWSPLVADTLASCGDDFAVRVWRVSSGESIKLAGHTDNVRALAWSTEVPHLLASGAWDGSVRLWDTRNGSCVRMCSDHHADVYGLDVSPVRPFIMASGSRDTTCRLWSMEDVIAPLRLRAISGAPWKELCGANAGKQLQPDSAIVLCGSGSTSLGERLRSMATEAEKQRAIHSFMSGADGTKELWDLVVSQQLGTACPMGNRVTLPRDAARRWEAKAKALEDGGSRRGGEIGAARREDVIREAAEIRIKLGHFKEYCEAMAELGRWVDAIAVAPAVGMQYWSSMCLRYAAALQQSPSATAAAGGSGGGNGGGTAGKTPGKPETFLMASGDASKLCEYFIECGRTEDAVFAATVTAAMQPPQQQQQQKQPASQSSNALIRRTW